MNLHDNKDISQAIRQGSKSYPNCLYCQNYYINQIFWFGTLLYFFTLER